MLKIRDASYSKIIIFIERMSQALTSLSIFLPPIYGVETLFERYVDKYGIIHIERYVLKTFYFMICEPHDSGIQD